MTESVRRLKANKVLEGKPCGWCAQTLAFGNDAAVCATCETAHHATCWDQKGGCSKAGCLNAPLKQLEPAADAPRTAAPPGKMACPHCGKLLREGREVCPFCHKVTTPDGIYSGPKKNAPEAVASMVWGIVGLFCFGIVLGFVAISKANSAKKAIAANPTYGGSGYATAGFVLGICDLVFWAIAIFTRFSK